MAAAAGLNDPKADMALFGGLDPLVAATADLTHPATLLEPAAKLIEGALKSNPMLALGTANLDEGMAAASRGMMELNGKLIDLMRAQTESVVSLWTGLMSVSSLSDAVRLQTSHMRKHYEDTAHRAKDIAETVTRVASGACGIASGPRSDKKKG